MPRTPGTCRHSTSPFGLSPLTRWRACTIFLPAQRCPTCGDWSTAGHEYGTCRAPDADLTDYSGGSTSDDEAVTTYARALRTVPTNPSYAQHRRSYSAHSRNARTRHRQCRRQADSARHHSPAPRQRAPSLSSSTSSTPSSPDHTCPLPHLHTPARHLPRSARKHSDPIGQQADAALEVYGYPITRYDMRTGKADRLSPDRGGLLEPNCWCLWGAHAHKNHRPIISLLTARARDGPIKSGGWDVLRGRGYGYRAFPGPEGESRPVWTQHIVFLLGGHGPRLQLNRACAREAEARGLLPLWPVRSRTRPTSTDDSDSSIERIPPSHLPRLLQKHTARLALAQTGTSRQAERAERGAWIVSDTFTAPGSRNTWNTRTHEEFWQRNDTTDYMEHGVFLPTSPNRFYNPSRYRRPRRQSSTTSSDSDASDEDDEDAEDSDSNQTLPITSAPHNPAEDPCKHSQSEHDSHTSSDPALHGYTANTRIPETETTRL
ncbi:Ja01 [Japanese cytomegalovirus]|nr:Ja01 [Japanese cytomegalovirus]